MGCPVGTVRGLPSDGVTSRPAKGRVGALHEASKSIQGTESDTGTVAMICLDVMFRGHGPRFFWLLERGQGFGPSCTQAGIPHSTALALGPSSAPEELAFTLLLSCLAPGVRCEV